MKRACKECSDPLDSNKALDSRWPLQCNSCGEYRHTSCGGPTPPGIECLFCTLKADAKSDTSGETVGTDDSSVSSDESSITDDGFIVDETSSVSALSSDTEAVQSEEVIDLQKRVRKLEKVVRQLKRLFKKKTVGRSDKKRRARKC